MEVTIGVQNLPRELVIEVDSEQASRLTVDLSEALAKGGLLELRDTKGRTVVVPASAIGYVEVGSEEVRRVGFGSL